MYNYVSMYVRMRVFNCVCLYFCMFLHLFMCRCMLGIYAFDCMDVRQCMLESK
jgi:hypothetical protein